MRRLRERRAHTAVDPILFERADWRLFIDPHTLPQKAGCEANQIGRVLLKELTDNAADEQAGNVTVEGNAYHAIVRDTGPGIDPAQITALFAVNRPLLSSKLKRLPTRGMLGNGLRVVMGAVAAFRGKIAVTTRGIRYQLNTNTTTGDTEIVTEQPVEDTTGTTVEVKFQARVFSTDDFDFARCAIQIAGRGETYTGYSQRAWYSRKALDQLIAAAPRHAAIREVTREVFGVPVDDIDRLPVRTFDPKRIGKIGDVISGCYRIVHGTAPIDEAAVPYCVEAWVEAENIEKNHANPRYKFNPFINRTKTLAYLNFWADSTGLRLHGCGIDFKVAGAKRADYTLALSLITPFLQLSSDGKSPYLRHFQEAIEKAVGGAAREAYQQIVRPPTMMTLKDAAWLVMRHAYMKASGNGKLPAKARQIMYAARGDLLRLTGAKKFSDTYFTQILLPDYLNEKQELVAHWDVVYDARGNLTEPHTGSRIPLGTIQVRTYLGERAPLSPAVQLNGASLYPTSGPENRYRNVLFVEKEGFDELWEAVRLAERLDLAIMSTKGMSVVAARKLLDSLADKVDRIFVLRDFDMSGFSIFGTLGTDSRRYTFENDMTGKIVDIGLRFEDVLALGLEAEKVEVENPAARRKKLRQHGATPDEIAFLAEPDDDGMCQRVELNAMTSPQLVASVERKLTEHGVAKVVPADEVIDEHARRLLERTLTKKVIDEMEAEITKMAKEIELPADLTDRIKQTLNERPALSWDQATSEILDRILE